MPDYTQCWASCLGECEGVISREHLISKCLFSDQKINVLGLPWCKDEAKTIGIESLTGKILCRKHNSALSEVDTGVKHSLETLGAAVDLHQVRGRMRSRHWAIRYFETDMLLLERWCLKTLINLNVSEKSRLPFVDSVSTGVPEELVRVVFGFERFSGHKELYIVARAGDTISMVDGQFAIRTQTFQEALAGAEFRLWRVPFFLNLTPFDVNRVKGARFLGKGMKQWFSTRDDKGRLVKSHLLTFKYPGFADAHGSRCE
jgi:hypothetical protein